MEILFYPLLMDYFINTNVNKHFSLIIVLIKDSINFLRTWMIDFVYTCKRQLFYLISIQTNLWHNVPSRVSLLSKFIFNHAFFHKLIQYVNSKFSLFFNNIFFQKSIFQNIFFSENEVQTSTTFNNKNKFIQKKKKKNWHKWFT